MNRYQNNSRRGNILLIAVFLLPALIALISLAVDYGRVQVAKSQLQDAADAAARYASTGLHDSTVLAKANAAANENYADGTPVVLQNSDVEIGSWDSNSRVFTAGSTPANAVRITARRTSARGNPVPLIFGKVIGRASCDVEVSAVGLYVAGASGEGFSGLDGIEFKNSSFIGSYNSAANTAPTPGTSTGRGKLASNGSISFKNNSTIHGDAELGPSSPGIDGKHLVVITGSTTTASSALTAPPDPDWSPGVNPGGIPQNYSVSNNTTLPGGTYWFTSLTVTKKLTFSGPATLYVNGDIWTDDDIVTYGSKPANLKIYQLGTGRTFDIQKQTTLIAHVQAPGSDLIGNNKLYLYGSGTYKSILAKNSAEFFHDESSSIAGSTTGTVTLVD